jgi:cytidine deaminase
MKASIKTTASLARGDRELIAAAKQARLRAHAPWSQFKVGAAARFGVAIVPGCNVEFDVYGLTNCAERSAIFSAFAIGAARKPLTAIAVVADTPDPVLPCGACRQVLFERGGPELRVILANLRGDARVMRMQELLPEGFRLETQTPAQATVRKRTARGTKSPS